MPFTKEEIQHLLVEKITGTISSEDDALVEQLIQEDEQVRELWHSIQQQVNNLQDQGILVEADAEEKWQEVSPLMQSHAKPFIILFARRAAVAAVVFLLLIGGYRLWNNSSNDSFRTVLHSETRDPKHITLSLENGQSFALAAKPDTFRYGSSIIEADEKSLIYSVSSSARPQQWTLSVPAAMDYKMTMADGTEVWLNAATTLRFEAGLSSKSRDVYLDGEAYFKVAKNKLRPFIVHTPQANILVTGTEFNVNTYEQKEISAALVEGSIVAERQNAQSVLLKPGFEVVCKEAEQAVTKRFDEAEVLSWMKGVYYFHDTPLRELSKVLSRWYGIQIHFNNDSVQAKMFSGELVKKQSLQTFIDYLKISADIDGRLEKGVLYFR